MPRTIDVREEVASTPIGAYHYLIAGLIALIVFFEGYDTFNASYVIHYVIGPWHLSTARAGLLVSSGMIGFSLASLVQGKLSDRIGRRGALLGGVWVATLFSFATAAWGHSFWTFFLWRFLTGLGLGVLLPVSVVYMNEFSPRHARSMFATWGWGLGFSMGGVAAAAVGVFLTPVYGWQALYYAASSSVVLAVVCHWLLPESALFLTMRGRPAEVGAVLARLDPSKAEIYLASESQFILPEPNSQTASWVLLFSPRYRQTTLAASTAAFFVLFAIYGLTGWVPTAMMARGETFSTSFTFGAVILGMNFIGTLACGFVMDRYGVERAAPAVWWLVGGLAVAVLAFANNHVVNAAAMVLAGFGILGGQGALNNLTARWYDTEVRGTAVGTMLGVGRIGGILGPYVVGLLQEFFVGSASTFLAVGVAACLGAISIAFVPRRPRELRGRVTGP